MHLANLSPSASVDTEPSELLHLNSLGPSLSIDENNLPKINTNKAFMLSLSSPSLEVGLHGEFKQFKLI